VRGALDDHGIRSILRGDAAAGIWLRVSSDGQDPRSTIGEPGIRIVIDGKDYGITPIVRPSSFDRMHATA